MSAVTRTRTRTSPGTYVGILVAVIVFGLPVYWILLSSFLKPDQLLSAPPTYVTTDPTLRNYQVAAEQLPLVQYLINSAVFSVGSAVLSVALSFLAAYAFVRLPFRGSSSLLFLLLLTMALPQIAVTIPLFGMLQKMGLVNTHAGLILLESSMLIPFTVWTMTSFLRQIPGELEEAAAVDGAGFWRTLWLIVTPLARPAIATMLIINLISSWNELFFPLVFASSDSVRPLTIALVQLTQVTSGTASRPWDLMSTLSALMILPIIFLVSFGQKHIVSGLSSGYGK